MAPGTGIRRTLRAFLPSRSRRASGVGIERSLPGRDSPLHGQTAPPRPTSAFKNRSTEISRVNGPHRETSLHGVVFVGVNSFRSLQQVAVVVQRDPCLRIIARYTQKTNSDQMTQEIFSCTWCVLYVICTVIFTLQVIRMCGKNRGSRRKPQFPYTCDGNARPAAARNRKSCQNKFTNHDNGGGGGGDCTGEIKSIKDQGKYREYEQKKCIHGPTIEKPMACAAKKDRSSGMKKILKGPLALPYFGCLHLLGGAGGPFQAFTALSRKYGDIYALKLGSSSCVVVSSYRLVKEVLVTKGNHFGGRPDFIRFHELFGGDRNNSLALCDWSALQRTRRSLARSYCSPRTGSTQQSELKRVAAIETSRFLGILGADEALPIRRGEEPFKPLLLAAVANMFTRYMCSSWFSYSDLEFRRTVRIFDEIFWEINQGYALDFLPWLSPFYTVHLKRLRSWATEIRTFILERIVNRRRSSLDVANGVSQDFTDALLLHLVSPDSALSWDHVIFELEDFLGGHSAIGNLVMLVLANVVKHPEVQARIQAECDAVQARRRCHIIDLEDRPNMPYTEAVIWETLRVSSSPIVPHVATRNTDIDGYVIRKDTVVFINNYELNLGETYWGPGSQEFRPERFLVPSTEPEGSWKLSRPAHFIPFSTGKRTCIGQRLVQGFTFATVVGLLSKYRVAATNQDANSKARPAPGCIAVPPDTFHLILTSRHNDPTHETAHKVLLE